MLRLAFCCSSYLVNRTMPRLVRCGLAPAFALPNPNLAQKMFLGPPKIRVAQNRLLVTSRLAPANKRSETPIVGSTGDLIEFDARWIPRPSFEKQVLLNFNINWRGVRLESGRRNDYRGIMIPGGIGVGKTRAALEVPYIVAQSLKHDDNIKVVWRISLDYRDLHHEITHRKENPAEVLFALFRETMVSKEFKPEKATSILPATLLELVESFCLIHNLKPSDNAVLYLHVDEFQMGPAQMTLLLRAVGKYLATKERPKVLVILILSGIGSQEFVKQTLNSSYKTDTMNLKLSVEPKWINALVDQFIQRIDRKQQQHVIQFRDNSPSIFFKLLKTTGGIPIFIFNLLDNLKYSGVGPVSAAQAAFEHCCAEMEGAYSATPHSTWFRTKDHAMLFLQKAFFKEPVARTDQLNGLTVGDLEESGLIYLESVQDAGLFTIGLPLMMLRYHNFASDLNLFTGLDCLKYPFKPIDEAKFEEFIAQIYTFSWRLLSYQKTTEVTLQYLHRGCLTASQELLEKKITLPHASIIGLEQMKALAKGSLGDFELLDRSRKFKLQRPASFVLRTFKRFEGADVVIPGQLQVQLKWSQYVGDMRAIRSANSPYDPTYFLTVGLVRKEIAKILPGMPLVIISPKVPQKALENECLDGEFPQVGLITDKQCMQFLEPFYCYSLDPTAKNPVGREKYTIMSEAATEVMPEVTPEAALKATTEVTLEATPAMITKNKKGTRSKKNTNKATPEVTTEAMPEVTPEAAPKATTEVTLEATPATITKNKKGTRSKKNTNKATPEVTTEAKH